jgi:uncharacterized membrane protein
VKLFFQITIPLILWLLFAWFISEGYKDKEGFWYVLLAPIVISGALGIFLLIFIGLGWLYS